MNELELEPMSNYVSRAQRWLWEAMIPTGAITLLAGAGGSSKSTLMAHLCADVTRGRLAGDDYGTPRGVIYLTQENDTERSLLPKMEAAGADLDKLFVMGGKAINVSDAKHRRALMEFATVHDVVLIVLDPLLPFVGNMGGSYGSSVIELTKLMEACADRGIALVGINHLTKNGKKADVGSMMGSVGIASTARQVLMVGKTDNEMLVGVVKSNVGPTGNGWVFSVSYEAIGEDDDLGGRVIDAPIVELVRPAKHAEVDAMFDDRPDLSTDMRTLTLLMYVHEHGSVDTQFAAEHLQREFDIKPRTARKTIGEAVSAGLVRRTTEGSGGELAFILSPTEAGGKLLGEIPTDVKVPRDLGAFSPYAWVEAQ